MKNSIFYFLNLIKRKQYKTPLGRWNIENCNKKLNNKIDLANEDHCGPCGKYIKNVLQNTDKIEFTKNNQITK
jgi:hypothetical protein